MSPMPISGTHPNRQKSTWKISRSIMVIATALLLLGGAMHRPPQATPAANPTTIPAGRKAETIAVISIDGPIDGVTTRSIERREDLGLTVESDERFEV